MFFFLQVYFYLLASKRDKTEENYDEKKFQPAKAVCSTRSLVKICSLPPFIPQFTQQNHVQGLFGNFQSNFFQLQISPSHLNNFVEM